MKLGEWTIILLGMTIFLELMGVTTGLSVLAKFGSSIANGTLTTTSLEGTSFWIVALAILATVSAGGAVVIGLFAKSYDTSLVIVPLITAVLLIFGSAFFSIMTIPEIVEEVWIRNIVGIIFTLMGVAFVWSAIDYFAGR